jgi:hypothetical protein
MMFNGTITPRCFIPRFDGGILSLKWKKAIWENFFPGATTTHASEQHTAIASFALDAEPGAWINPKMVPKWRARATVEDMKTS